MDNAWDGARLAELGDRLVDLLSERMGGNVRIVLHVVAPNGDVAATSNMDPEDFKRFMVTAGKKYENDAFYMEEEGEVH